MSGTANPHDSLASALKQLSIEIDPELVPKIEAYCQLLWDANQRINLTRHTTWTTFVARDLVDVLQLSSLIEPNQRVLDIGSGGGVPGLVLAILRPDLQVTLSESIGKKARLLQEFAEKLQVKIEVRNARAEEILDSQGFDLCTARAAGPIWKLLTWLNGRWGNARRLLAFKGPRWQDEVAEAKTRNLTRRLLIAAVVRYPLHSTDPDAPPVEGVIVRIAPDDRPGQS